MRRARRAPRRSPGLEHPRQVDPRGEGRAGEPPALQRFVQRGNVGASSRSAAPRCCKSLPIASESGLATRTPSKKGGPAACADGPRRRPVWRARQKKRYFRPTV
jgi:hypothetical protein